MIKKITEDINNFQFNTAISQIMELINTISKIGTNLETALIMAKLIAPFAPFIAEDIWENLNQSASIHEQEWPTYDSKLIIDNEITLVIQVNGKKKTRILEQGNIHTVTGFSYLTIFVNNVEQVIKNATKHGYKPHAQSPQILPAGLPQDVCLLMLKDPDGNFVEIVGPLTEKLKNR